MTIHFLPGGFLCPEGAKHGITKVRGGYSAPLVSDKVLKDANEFVNALYSNEELLMKIREHLRIRGFGFSFETKYTVTDEEESAPVQGHAEPDNEDNECNEGEE